MISVSPLVLFAVLVGSSTALPIDYLLPPDLPYDYPGSFYQPCIGSAPCRPFPFGRFGNGFSSGSLAAVANSAAFGSDYISPLDVNYPYGVPKTVDVAKENFVRGYGYGQTEYGVRDEVTIRPSFASPPFLNAPYSRFCSYLPVVSGCYRGANRYPFQPPIDYAFGY